MTKYYSGWKTDQQRCKSCGHVAAGNQFATGEIYAELIGYMCPSCGEEAFIVELPTPEEVLENRDKAHPADVLQAQMQIAARKGKTE